jgi:hypothetical protein
MFKKIIDTIFGSHYKTSLEIFVDSKKPKTVADVDFWVQHYYQTRSGGLL